MEAERGGEERGKGRGRGRKRKGEESGNIGRMEKKRRGGGKEGGE